MQLRTTDHDAVVAELGTIAADSSSDRLEFYVAESCGGWLAVFPNFTPELEKSAKALSSKLDCLIVLFLSADEDDLYCMFFRAGKQLPWFKIAVGKKRGGQERVKLAAKLEPLAETCDVAGRQELLEVLADASDVTFSSELLAAACEILGVRNAMSSFDYIRGGEYEGLHPPVEPKFVSA